MALFPRSDALRKTSLSSTYRICASQTRDCKFFPYLAYCQFSLRRHGALCLFFIAKSQSAQIYALRPILHIFSNTAIRFLLCSERFKTVLPYVLHGISQSIAAELCSPLRNQPSYVPSFFSLTIFWSSSLTESAVAACILPSLMSFTCFEVSTR